MTAKERDEPERNDVADDPVVVEIVDLTLMNSNHDSLGCHTSTFPLSDVSVIEVAAAEPCIATSTTCVHMMTKS